MQQWQQFLQNTQPDNDAGNHQTVVLEGGKVISFGDPVAERLALVNGTVICDLSHLGLLELKGTDAITFLQGQVTNDIKLLDGNNAHYTGYCSAKGRLLALFLAFSHYDHIHLQMPKELIESIAKRLKMYVMRSKVEITDVSESIIKFGISGANAAELLTAIFKELPQKDFDLVSLDNGAVIKLPGNTSKHTSRYEILTDTLNAPIIWQALAKNAKAVGADCWEWLEIQAGIPEVTLKTQEEFVPQMLNLDALNAINYKKGCYTGQEIVARTHYLGKIKRRTQLAFIAGIAMPQTGDDVVDAKQIAIGKIVRSAPAIYADIGAGFDILVECRLENLAQEDIYWQNVALVIKPLPYMLESSDAGA